MINGYGGKKAYLTEFELCDEQQEDFFYELPSYPHTMPHENRTKNAKKEDIRSINELSWDNLD